MDRYTQFELFDCLAHKNPYQYALLLIEENIKTCCSRDVETVIFEFDNKKRELVRRIDLITFAENVQWHLNKHYQ